MSDLEQLTNIIGVILKGSNEARKESEETLKQIRERDANQYVMCFINLLNESPHKEVRVFCAVHLRRNLSDFVDNAEESLWLKLNDGNQRAVKQVLWECLKKEDQPQVRKVLTELVGEMAATVTNMKEKGEPCSAEAQNWEGLMASILELLVSNNLAWVENALKILAILFTFCMNDYSKFKEDLIGIFKQTLDHPEYKIKACAVEAFTSFLKTADWKNCKFFLDLVPLLLTDVLFIIDKDEDVGAEALSHISDVIEGESLMFKKNFRDLYDMLKLIVERKVSQPLKEGALENLVMAVEKLTKHVRKNKDLIKDIFATIFSFMVQSTEEINKEWLIPPEGYSERNENNDAQDYSVRYCMQLIDRLVVCLGHKLALPIISDMFLEMTKMSDWRYTYSALMALSQVGEYVEELVELDPIVDFIMSFFHHENPKVRYAALHAIGQIADDKEEEFQQRYLDKVLPAVINCLGDSVPHVVSHGLNAITNIIQKESRETGLRYIPHLLEPLLKLIQTGISLVKEGALSALSCLIAACEEEFIPYWEKTATIVFSILKDATKKEYKQLRGQAIECLTVTGLCIGKQEFMKVTANIIEIMAEIQQNHIEEVDPQKSYLLLGWERICSIMGTDFLPYLDKILPPVLSLIEAIIQEEIKKEKNLENKEEKEVMNVLGVNKRDKRTLFYSTNTTESEEAKIAVNLIEVFVNQLKEGYLPYLEKTSDLLTYLLDNSDNEDLRIAVGDTLAGLIVVIKSSNIPDKDGIVHKITNVYLDKLWELLWAEFDYAEDIAMLVNCIKKIILAAGRYMNEQEVKSFNEKILKLLHDSETRKGVNNLLINNKNEGGDDQDDYDTEDEIDDEEIEYLEEENNNEEKLSCAVAELIGAMLVIYKEQTVYFAELIYREVLPNVFNPALSVLINKFGLLIVNAMLKALGPELLQNEVPKMTKLLCDYTVNKHAPLREVAAQGIRILAEVAKDGFRDLAEPCIIALGQALAAEKLKDESNNEYKSARENVVATLGQIIKSQFQNINQKEVIQIWLKGLPVNHDESIARVQHELLADLILEINATLIFGENGESLPHVVEVFAHVLGTRLSSALFEDKVGKILQLLIGNENTKTILQVAVGNLDQKLQDRIKKVVK